jgi:hypothetical protein
MENQLLNKVNLLLSVSSKAIIVVAMLSLPFHFILIPNNYQICAKRSLSLEYTFLTTNDENEFIDKWNKADMRERLKFNDNAGFKKLEDLGIIVSANKE